MHAFEVEITDILSSIPIEYQLFLQSLNDVSSLHVTGAGWQ